MPLKILTPMILVVWLLGPTIDETAVASSAEPQTLVIGQTLREANLAGLNGPDKALSSFRGKPLIINVWASWCGPCRAEMASLERLAWRSAPTRFSIIGISTDDYVDQAQTLLKNTHATLSQFIDSNLQMETMLGATHLPLTVLIGADGRILEKVYGAREWDNPESLLLIDKAFGKEKRQN